MDVLDSLFRSLPLDDDDKEDMDKMCGGTHKAIEVLKNYSAKKPPGIGTSITSGTSTGQAIGQSMPAPGGSAGASFNAAKKPVADAVNTVTGTGPGSNKPKEAAPKSTIGASSTTDKKSMNCAYCDSGSCEEHMEKALNTRSFRPVSRPEYDADAVRRNATQPITRFFSALQAPINEEDYLPDEGQVLRAKTQPVYKSCAPHQITYSLDECPACRSSKFMQRVDPRRPY